MLKVLPLNRKKKAAKHETEDQHEFNKRHRSSGYACHAARAGSGAATYEADGGSVGDAGG